VRAAFLLTPQDARTIGTHTEEIRSNG
jgi:hypothetical protein